nr:hypothetical protein [Mesorhizobium camelthorni]
MRLRQPNDGEPNPPLHGLCRPAAKSKQEYGISFDVMPAAEFAGVGNFSVEPISGCELDTDFMFCRQRVHASLTPIVSAAPPADPFHPA